MEFLQLFLHTDGFQTFHFAPEFKIVTIGILRGRIVNSVCGKLGVGQTGGRGETRQTRLGMMHEVHMTIKWYNKKTGSEKTSY